MLFQDFATQQNAYHDIPKKIIYYGTDLRSSSIGTSDTNTNIVGNFLDHDLYDNPDKVYIGTASGNPFYEHMTIQGKKLKTFHIIIFVIFILIILTCSYYFIKEINMF